ncbi:MAG: hypothetical protein V7K53_00160 [Nostoc sp.]|uniref:hypothetical protein n=1 Tax=Nostoc sp. TaxID=1180 RepID=UPI002FFCA25E
MPQFPVQASILGRLKLFTDAIASIASIIWMEETSQILLPPASCLLPPPLFLRRMPGVS